MTEILLTITVMAFVASVFAFVIGKLAIGFWRVAHVILIATISYECPRGRTLRYILSVLWVRLKAMFLTLFSQALYLTFVIALIHFLWFVRRLLYPNRIQVSRHNELSCDTPNIRIILVHGAHSSGRFFPRWLPLLNSIQSEFRKVEVFTATWSGRNNELVRQRDGDLLGRKCDEILQQNNQQIPVRVIGHSQGGSVGAHIVAHLLECGYDARLISIATPYVKLDGVENKAIDMYVGDFLSEWFLSLLIWAVIAIYFAKFRIVKDIAVFMSDHFGPYPMQLPDELEGWMMLCVLGLVLISSNLLIKLYLARKLYTTHKLKSHPPAFRGKNHAVAIVVNGDEVESAIRLSVLSKELDYVQRRFFKFWRLLSKVNRKKLEQQYGNKFPTAISVIGAMAIGVGATIAVYFFGSTRLDPRMLIIVSAGTVALILSPITSRHSNWWRVDIDTATFFLFFPVHISSFVRRVIQARLAGLWPWSLCFFFQASIRRTLYDTWEPVISINIPKALFSIRHSSVMEDKALSIQVCTLLLNWVASIHTPTPKESSD